MLCLLPSKLNGKHGGGCGQERERAGERESGHGVVWLQATGTTTAAGELFREWLSSSSPPSSSSSSRGLVDGQSDRNQLILRDPKFIVTSSRLIATKKHASKPAVAM